MPRKKEPTHITEGDIFPTRLRELMEEKAVTQKKLADAIGMRPQTVSLYTTGQSAPDVNTLRKMADFFNISADYFLGLSDVKKPDATIQAICDYTGLSEAAISALHENKISNQNTPIYHPYESRGYNNVSLFPDDLSILSYLLATHRFFGVLKRFVDLGWCSVGRRTPMQLLENKELLATEMFESKGYRVISPIEKYYLLRYELLHSFEHIVDHFTSEIENAFTDDEGGSENAINQEND